jgi:hypothetical protein
LNAELDLLIELIPFLIPLILIQMALMIIAVLDLVKREHVTGNNKLVWILVIIFINIIGPIIYFVFGRKDRADDSD